MLSDLPLLNQCSIMLWSKSSPRHHIAGSLQCPCFTIFFLKEHNDLCLYRRLHEEQQNVLEVIELCASKELPGFGLRLIFQEALCPFAYLCEHEVGPFMTPYVLMFINFQSY
jgi:hypothetical protein